jgi:hypothetical protein
MQEHLCSPLFTGHRGSRRRWTEAMPTSGVPVISIERE